MVRVLVTGSAVLDFVYQVEMLPARAEKYRAGDMQVVGGGCAANAAVAITRLGGQAQLLARFGRDEIANLVTKDLMAEGVDLSLLEIARGGRSAVSSVYLDASGERQIMSFRGSGLPNAPTPLADVQADAILADTRWPQATQAAFVQGKALGAPCVLDGEAPVTRPLAMAASHVVFSEQGLLDFAQMDDVQNALAMAAGELPGWVGVTRGAAGVFWIENGAEIHLPGFEVSVKDTLGAGDVWHGAFALRLGEGATERDAALFANAAAALKCQGHGGRKATPDRAMVEQFLRDRI